MPLSGTPQYMFYSLLDLVIHDRCSKMLDLFLLFTKSFSYRLFTLGF